jgi:UDP-N-acetylenolpyruvoylglucosamine reductase
VTRPASVEEGVPLARLTTFGAGGPARFFARPDSVDELVELLAWAAAEGVAVEPIGLGSNVLAADAGVDALVLRLAGELAAARIEGDVLVAGGGASNAVCLHRARDAGLGGFEFASAIPGTAGGGVSMNAGAYGSDWQAITIDAVIAGPGGTRTLAAEKLGYGYRRSGLEAGEVVAQVSFRLLARDPGEIRARVAELLEQRKATQPTTKRTFGSVFKNPPQAPPGAGQLIETCGLKGHRIGGALISPRHANFIENAGGATAADALALMAEARERVATRFGVELEHEVRFLGELELPLL